MELPPIMTASMMASARPPHPVMSRIPQDARGEKGPRHRSYGVKALLETTTPLDFATTSQRVRPRDRLVAETVTTRHSPALSTNLMKAREIWMAERKDSPSWKTQEPKYPSKSHSDEPPTSRARPHDDPAVPEMSMIPMVPEPALEPQRIEDSSKTPLLDEAKKSNPSRESPAVARDALQNDTLTYRLERPNGLGEILPTHAPEENRALGQEPGKDERRLSPIWPKNGKSKGVVWEIENHRQNRKFSEDSFIGRTSRLDTKPNWREIWSAGQTPGKGEDHPSPNCTKTGNSKGDPFKIRKRPQNRQISQESDIVITSWFDKTGIKIGAMADTLEKVALAKGFATPGRMCTRNRLMTAAVAAASSAAAAAAADCMMKIFFFARNEMNGRGEEWEIGRGNQNI